MIVNYYDLLDVEPTASRDEIRAAWKAAVGDLDPSDRRFRAYNSAAEVLLDDDRRKEYDARLAAEAPEAEAPEAAEAPGTGVAKAPEWAPPEPAAPAAPTTGSGRAGARMRLLGAWLVPAWLLVGLLIVTIAVAGVDAWLAQRPSDAQVASDTTAAQAAAERAIVPLLSYDYRKLGESKAAATAYLSPSYQTCYDKLFTLIEQNAAAAQPVITTQVVASGIVRSGGSDSDRVQVLVFVDRPTTNKVHPTPIVYHDEVTVTMVRSGNDWLVDWLQTQANGQVPAGAKTPGQC